LLTYLNILQILLVPSNSKDSVAGFKIRCLPAQTFLKTTNKPDKHHEGHQKNRVNLSSLYCDNFSLIVTSRLLVSFLIN